MVIDAIVMAVFTSDRDDLERLRVFFPTVRVRPFEPPFDAQHACRRCR